MNAQRELGNPSNTYGNFSLGGSLILLGSSSAREHEVLYNVQLIYFSPDQSGGLIDPGTNPVSASHDIPHCHPIQRFKFPSSYVLLPISLFLIYTARKSLKLLKIAGDMGVSLLFSNNQTVPMVLLTFTTLIAPFCNDHCDGGQLKGL